MLIFPFYKTSLFPPSINGNIIYEVYSKGSVIHTEKLNLKHNIEVEKWMQKERQGWKYDLNSYAYSRVLRNDNININCSGKLVIINYDTGKDWIQIAKKTECPIGQVNAVKR